MRTVIGVLAAIVLALGAITLARNLLNNEPEAPAALPRATAFPIEEPFWGKVRSFAAVGPGTLKVKMRLLNTGNAIDDGECDLIAYDQVAAVASMPVSTGGPATPGYGVPVTEEMKIPNKGAAAIERVEVSC